MPARLAEVTRPASPALSANSRVISGTVTPPMNTTKPSKNLPDAASAQMRHCMPVMGVDFSVVPSDHTGNSSIYSCTVLAGTGSTSARARRLVETFIAKYSLF